MKREENFPKFMNNLLLMVLLNWNVNIKARLDSGCLEY